MLPIAGQTAGPNALNFFCGHSWVAGGCFRLKQNFFHGQRRALQLVYSEF